MYKCDSCGEFFEKLDKVPIGYNPDDPFHDLGDCMQPCCPYCESTEYKECEEEEE